VPSDDEKKKEEEKEEKKETEEEREAREEREAEERERQEEIDKDLTKLKADRDKWKREARKWEDRAKANSEKARKFDELDAKSKTETERLVAAESETKNTKKELIRTRVALRKGLTENQAKRLIGETEEEMEADADELLETFGGKVEGEEQDGKERPARKRPEERLRTAVRTGARGRDEEPDPSKDEIKKIVDRSMDNNR
jgi:hypothetical protein